MVNPEQARSKEEEYFLKQELERRRKVAQEEEARLAEEARRAQKELHWMHCPKCGHQLEEVAYHTVKIDQCAACGGIWLDAGELDQLATKESGGLLSSFRRLLG